MSDSTSTIDYFQIVKDYIANINGTQANNTDSQNLQIETIQKSLADMYNNYGNAVSLSQSILNQQKSVGNIVTNEQQRINTEHKNIQQLLETNTRSNDLKENARKRQNAYNYMLFVFIIILLICLILSFIKKTIPVIPEAVFSFLYVLVIAIGVIYLSVLYYSISTRDMLNFDELHFSYSPKNSKDVEQAQAKARKKGDLLGSVFNPNICIGEDCCTESTIFDKGVGKCIIPCPEGSLDLQGKCIIASECKGNNIVCGNSCIPNTQRCLVSSEGFLGLSINQKVEPFSPSEFENYHKYSKE